MPGGYGSLPLILVLEAGDLQNKLACESSHIGKLCVQAIESKSVYKEKSNRKRLLMSTSGLYTYVYTCIHMQPHTCVSTYLKTSVYIQ